MEKVINPVTNFARVTEFNAVLGQGVAQAPCIPSLEQCNLRLGLIREEALEELGKAMDKRDLVAVADAIGDALVVVYGAANDCGLDADAIMAEIHRSNMSKLCDSEQDAVFAVEQYRAGNGFHGKNEPIEAGYRESSIPGKFVVVDLKSGKTLKGPSYVEPNIEPIVFPAGRPVDPFAPLRELASNISSSTPQALWQFNSILDKIASLSERPAVAEEVEA